MSEETTAAEKACLRCGGGHLLSAQMEHPTAFCMDHAAHHGRVHLSLKALLCQDCGHIEFWTPNPSRIVRQREATTIQEEDF